MGGRGSNSGMSGGARGGGGGGRTASLDTKSQHLDAIRALNNDRYPDGTYDLATMKRINYSDGYQVTFWQIGDNYSNAEYADKVNEFLDASTDRVASAGKYGGDPEVSFHVSSLPEAMRLAKKYNQDSIFDWSAGEIIDNPDGDGINHNAGR